MGNQPDPLTVTEPTSRSLGRHGWDFLACPRCRQDLPRVADWLGEGIACAGCGVHYHVLGGIPRFVEADDYAGSFSFEWLRHRRTQLDGPGRDESERTFREKTGLAPEDLQDKLVLDVGCGMGRFADVVSRWGARVVAVDLSLAVEAARENLAGRDNVVICQADLFHLPFREGQFNLIYSIGVLHHTPDCEQAFRNLVRFLAPGGTIVIWLYAQDHGLWAKCSDFYRRWTVTMRSRALHRLCHIAVPFYYLVKLPVIGRILWTLVPVSVHPDPDWRVLDTFDWYSPRYQSKHTYPEVYRWFQSEGLVQIKLLDVPVALSGVKPVYAGRSPHAR